MQGLPQQHIMGKDIPFELVFAGNLDQLDEWAGKED